MCGRGALLRLHRGVYLVGVLALPHSHELAAVLACGPSAALSHASAAHLYGLLPYPARQVPLHVTVPRGHLAGDDAIVVHETKALLAHEVREREGIRVTAPIRTIVDLAARCSPELLEAAVAEAFALRLVNRNVLVRAARAARGRRGVARLRVMLDDGPVRTRSTPERRLLKLIRATGMPQPLANYRIGPWEADLYWPDHGLVVEVDGYAAHSSPWAFERDRRKNAELEDRGLTVRRVSALQIRDEPDRTVTRIAHKLAELARAASKPP